MSGRSVVVDADYGVDVFFAEGTYQVVGALLHFGVGALHGVQFDAAGVTARIDRADGAAAQSDAVVVAAHNHYFVTFLRCAFQAVALRAVAHAAGQHNHFVIAIFLAVFLMFEREHGTGDQRLAELVAEVRGAV
ncbi:hypothetical protein IMSAGC014_00399 [Bacteroidaceae bacterium]|nr:hypothetical protein IMSAGC014_00399 [Bacteroidaceae bacterium]